MALISLGVWRPVPAITILEVLPRRFRRHRTFGIYKKDRNCSGLPVTDLEVVKGRITRATGDHAGHFPHESCSLDELAEGPAQVGLLLPCAAATLNIYLHPHHLLPPISPFDQSSPSLYLSSQGLRFSLSNRRKRVAPRRFPQMITDSGVSVSASMSVSEWVVTTS